MNTQVIFCEYDGTSRVPGARLGASVIYQESFLRLAPLALREHVRHHRMETQNSAIYCKRLEQLVDAAPNFRLAIGGEHLITFPILVALKKRKPDLKLVVLDAHHDAYPYPVSTHYSVFYHVCEELKIPVLFLGTRYEEEKAYTHLNQISSLELQGKVVQDIINQVRIFLGNAPFYLSLDLDVINPDEFQAVSAPVARGLGVHQVTEIVRALLCQEPVACDVVEYNSMRDIFGLSDFPMLKKTDPLFELFYRWVAENPPERKSV